MLINNNKIMPDIIPEVHRGIELGALHHPVVDKGFKSIRYIDHASTEDLIIKYKTDAAVDLNNLVDVDYVWNGEPLRPLLGDYVDLDFAVASHVMEHVANPIHWINEIHSVLSPGGIIGLALPDKRFCFDYKRRLTSPADMIDAYLLNFARPTPRMVFDHYSNAVHLEGVIAWGEPQDPSLMKNVHSLEEAYEKARQAAVEGNYLDIHCLVFTPTSFLNCIEVIGALGLLPFQIVEFYDSVGYEFCVVLQALPQTNLDMVKEKLKVSIKTAREKVIRFLPEEK